MKKFFALVLVLVMLLSAAASASLTTLDDLKAKYGGSNVLRRDTREDAESGEERYVLGTPYNRKSIASIHFMDSLDEAAADTYDVSAAGDKSVQAWFRKNGELFDLYIAAEGGVIANEDCSDLFYGYWNVTEINCNDCFDTSNVINMDSMFSCCFDLVYLDMDGCDTSNVESMYFMFSSCSSLINLDMSGFDTGSVTTMSHMFWNCESLEFLDLSSFEVGDETDVGDMFTDCPNLDTVVKNFDVAEPTPKPTAKPTAKPVEYYPPLRRGDKGDDVYTLQMCLIEFGYLGYGEADGSYGKKTASAVHRFKEQNYLYDNCSSSDSCEATSEMLGVLYSGDAYVYTEPDMALAFPEPCNMNYYNESGDMLKFRVEVQNVSAWRTVEAFEIRAYATDDWGDPLYGDGYYYYETTKKTVAPGATTYSTYLYIPDRSDIYKVYVGISKVRYSDGTTAEAYPVEYWNWTM